jgi:hypothetical protein
MRAARISCVATLLAVALFAPAAVLGQRDKGGAGKDKTGDRVAPKAVGEPGDKKEPPPEEKQAAGAGGLVCCGFSGIVLFAGIAVASIAGIAFYMLPTIIAVKRGHPNVAPVVAVNLLLGWLFIGWVVALVWALTAFDRPRRRYYRDDDND